MAVTNSLVNKLKAKIEDPISNNTNFDWYIFILDHLSYIRENSKTVVIGLEEKYKFRWRFKGFLRYINTDHRLDWLILLINNLTNPDEFVIRDSIYVCEKELITKLYRNFKTTQQLHK